MSLSKRWRLRARIFIARQVQRSPSTWLTRITRKRSWDWWSRTTNTNGRKHLIKRRATLNICGTPTKTKKYVTCFSQKELSTNTQASTVSATKMTSSKLWSWEEKCAQRHTILYRKVTVCQKIWLNLRRNIKRIKLTFASQRKEAVETGCSSSNRWIRLVEHIQTKN